MHTSLEHSSPRVSFVRSPAAADRIERALRWLAAHETSRELIVVGATREATADVIRRASMQSGSHFGWHRFTLGRLAATLAGPALASSGLSAVGTLPLEAVSARVVHALVAANALGRFAAIANRPGLPRALVRTLGELRRAGLTAEQLDDPDLARVMLAFEAELAVAKLADRAHVFALAAAALEAEEHDAAAIDHPLSNVRSVLLLDVAITDRSEARFVDALLGRAGDVLVTIPAGDLRTTMHLRAEWASAIEDVRLTVEPSHPLRAVQSALFAEEAVDTTSAANVMVFSAPGESRECVEIARLVLHEAEQGTAFDRMAIVLRSPDAYRSHLAEAFRRARIPAHFERGAREPDPAGRAFVSLLACAAEGLSAARFAEYLSLGEVPNARPDGSPPEAPPARDRFVPPDEEMGAVARPETDETPTTRTPEEPSSLSADPDTQPVVEGTLRAPRFWERLIVDAAVIGGLDRWERRLEGLRKSLELAAGEEQDERYVARAKRDRQSLDNLRRFAMPLLRDLSDLPREARWGEWIDRLSALARRALRNPERVLSVLFELAPMSDVAAVDLTSVRLVLDHRLTTVTRAPTGRRLGAVYVASTEEARGLEFDVVFVPGLAEKVFPRKVAEDPILPDRERVKISDRLETLADRTRIERLALRLAVGAARRKIVLSYPRMDIEQSRPRTPSFYGLEVLRAAERTLPGFEELARRADKTVPARLGWPAPDRPGDAIDEAEHDLSLLEPLLRKPESEAIGTAHYLLTANAHLARALRFRARRYHNKWHSADGLVDPSPAAKVALAAHSIANRSFSPTALQNYASCPYRFLLQAVHRLSPREEPAPLEELDPLQRGALIHEVQFELYGVLRNAGLLPITAAHLAEARRHLDRVLDGVVARYRDDLAPAIDRVWTDGINAIRADLREWLRRAPQETRWVPSYFELSFGLPDRRDQDPHSVKDPVRLDCGIQLRGSIDLVERSVDGMLRATDHKSGKVRAKAATVIDGGKTLQPVFYALALQQIMPGDRVESGRLYYCTSAGEFTDVSIALNEDAREAAKVVAEAVDSAISGGFLPAAPEKGACEYCDYQRVCGPDEERRIRRKSDEKRLAPLTRLRRRA